MLRRAFITFATFVFVGGTVFAAGAVADDSVGAPRVIIEDSLCPAAGCSSDSCHGFDDVPAPDGNEEMTCPEVGCSSVECHAWDTLSTRYHQASDASLNLWILAPVTLVMGLVLIVRKADESREQEKPGD